MIRFPRFQFLATSLLLVLIMLVTTGCPYSSKHQLDGKTINFNTSLIGNWHHKKIELKISRINDQLFNVYYKDHDTMIQSVINGQGYCINNGSDYVIVKDKNTNNYFTAKILSISRDKIRIKMLADDRDDELTSKIFSSAKEFTDAVLKNEHWFPYETGYIRDDSFTQSEPAESTTETSSMSREEVVFNDDFTGAKHNWGTNKTFKDSAYFYVSASDEPNPFYYVSNRRTGGLYIPIPYTVPNRNNSIFKVKARHIDDGYDVMNKAYGIKFAASDWSNSYNFDITANGYYRISKHELGLYTVIVPWTKFKALNQGLQYNTLKVASLLNVCIFYINDSKVYVLKDFMPFGKTLGLEVFDKQTIHFDDVEVSELKFD